MSNLEKDFVLDQIENLNSNLLRENDGIKTGEEITQGVVKIAQESVKKANETESVDEKLKLLVQGLQQSVFYCEQYVEKHRRKIEDWDLQVSTLENLISSAEAAAEKGKKNPTIDWKK